MNTTLERLALVSGLWLLLFALRSMASPWAATLAAAVALAVVLFLPGWALACALERSSDGRVLDGRRLEGPARWFTLSVGAFGLLGLLCAAGGASLSSLIAAGATLTVLGVLFPRALPGKQAGSADAAGRSDGESAGAARLAAAAVVGVSFAYAWMAAGGDNIARDRMWYMAYVGSLASEPGAIDWSEPLLGSGWVAARFAYNAWILTLAVLAKLSGLSVPLLFERVLPPLIGALLPSAAFALGRTLFRTTARAAIVAICTTAVVLTTRYPFFSPQHYAGFGRLAEDKTVALLLFSPVFLASALSVLGGRRRLDPGLAGILLVAAASVALSHAIVYLVALISLTTFVAGKLIERGSVRPDRGSRTTPPLRSMAAVLSIAALTACAPAVIGWQARNQITGGDAATVGLATSGDPVVRAHLRMNRLRSLARGGPITEPSLLYDPLLLAALLALLPAWKDRRSPWGLFAWTSAAPMLLLAFTPYLAPAFGRLIVPWMAYRVLWGIPFGVLLAGLLLRGPPLLFGAGPRLPRSVEGRRARSHRGGSILTYALGALLLLACAARIPWQRLSPVRGEPARSGVRIDSDTRELLSQLRALPAGARIAAGPGLAELIPAYTGHPILAFSDRGTAAFSRSRREATRRLEANALLIGMHGVERRLRSRIVGFYDVAYTVYEGGHCDRGTVRIFRNRRFALCAERKQSPQRFRLPLFRALAPASAGDPVVAAIDQGIVCSPSLPGKRPPVLHRWQRPSRWSGSFPSVLCRASLPRAARTLRLRVSLHLPRADELLIYRIAARSSSGVWRKKRGGLEFRENPSAELAVPGHGIDRLRLRLVPAYLPYLNLTELQLLAPGTPAAD